MRRLSYLVVLLGSLARVPASAQPAALPLELTWQAPSECPTASDVHAELARIASAAPGEDLRPLAARVAVARTGARYTAQLSTEHEGLSGERTLQADDCATLTRSVTLVLALAFGRSVQLRAEATEETAPKAQPASTTAPTEATPQQPDSTSKPIAEPDELEVAEDEAQPERGSSFRVGLLLGGGAQLTLLPSLAPVLTVGAALAVSRYSVELRASGVPGVSTTLAADGARAVLDGALATALACAHLSLADLCAGARAGAIRARARSLIDNGRQTAPWYALALGAGVRWPEHGPVQVSLEGLLALSLTRPRFEVTGLGVAHRAPVLAPELSAFVRFWP